MVASATHYFKDHWPLIRLTRVPHHTSICRTGCHTSERWGFENPLGWFDQESTRLSPDTWHIHSLVCMNIVNNWSTSEWPLFQYKNPIHVSFAWAQPPPRYSLLRVNGEGHQRSYINSTLFHTERLTYNYYWEYVFSFPFVGLHYLSPLSEALLKPVYDIDQRLHRATGSWPKVRNLWPYQVKEQENVWIAEQQPGKPSSLPDACLYNQLGLGWVVNTDTLKRTW